MKTITLSQAQLLCTEIKTLDASAPIELKLQDYRDERALRLCGFL